jgi:PPP family 3-phenylpropionic acid transporter
LADRLDAPRIVLSLCSVAAALIALGYLSARGLWVLCAIGAFHSAALAPLAPLSDTLALGAATGGRSNDTLRRRFEYGWVRGAGSAAFIFGSVLSGQAVGHFGIGTVVWLSAALLTTAAFAAILVPQLPPVQDAARPIAAMGGIHGIGALLRLPLYRRVVLIAALIMGSHAMHDSFAVIRWGAAGINPGISGLLWSLSVAAEVIVFLFIGHPLLERFGPSGAATLAAAAGIVRWAVTAETTWLPALVAIEPLHGLTFALLHLTCMRLLAGCVSRRLAATALTVYGAGVGASATLLTLASGPLYARFGAHGFWVMAALCAAALPVARMLREPSAEPT